MAVPLLGSKPGCQRAPNDRNLPTANRRVTGPAQKSVQSSKERPASCNARGTA